jgi:hypothetical protein
MFLHRRTFVHSVQRDVLWVRLHVGVKKFERRSIREEETRRLWGSKLMAHGDSRFTQPLPL